MKVLYSEEQNFACEFVKRLVLAWDPDYTKVTLAEAEVLKQAEANFARGDFVPDSAIDWE